MANLNDRMHNWIVKGEEYLAAMPLPGGSVVHALLDQEEHLYGPLYDEEEDILEAIEEALEEGVPLDEQTENRFHSVRRDVAIRHGRFLALPPSQAGRRRRNRKTKRNHRKTKRRTRKARKTHRKQKY